MSWLTTTSAAAKTASVAALSPASQSKMWLAALPGRSSRMTGAPGSSARSASATTGSGSYSTWISSSASRAEYRSWATTNAISWPWKRTLSVARTACASWDIVGIQASPSPARSCPVNTASTRGWASAATVSIAVILACGWGLRRIAPYSMPGSWMSSTNTPRPRMKRASSLRGTGPYAPFGSALMSLPPSRCVALRCPLDRPHDVLVARAPAYLAGQRLPDLRGRRVRVVIEQPAGGQHHARRAEPALELVAAGGTLMDRVEPAVPFQAFHREHPPAVGHGREHRARLHRQLVHPDHAGAAVRGVAAPVRAGEPELIAQEVDQQQPRLDLTGERDIVDGHGDLHGLPLRPAPRDAQGAHGELGGQMPLVVGRAALIGDGAAVPGGDLTGPGEGLVSGGRAAQELLGLRRRELARADRGEPDPGIGHHIAGQPDGGPGRAHRPVPDPAAHLLVGAAAAQRDRDPDLGEHLARAHHGLVGPGVEFPGRYRPAAVRAVDDHAGLQRRERRRQVLGRVGLAEGAADRPPVAHDGIGDHLLGVVEDREMPAHGRRVEQLRMPGQRPDPQLTAVDLEIGQLAEPVDVDQGPRLREPQLHHRDQAVPAGQDPRLRAVPGEQAERVLDAGCLLVLDMRRHLHAPLPPIPARVSSLRGQTQVAGAVIMGWL